MAGEVQVNDLVILVMGTASMLIMLAAIILFAFLFRRSLLKKSAPIATLRNFCKNKKLQSAYVLIQGQDEERKRIASDVHDNLGSLLATIKIYSDLAVKNKGDDETDNLNVQSIAW